MNTDRTTRVLTHTLWAMGILLAGILSAGSAAAQSATLAKPATGAPPATVAQPVVQPATAAPEEEQFGDPVVTAQCDINLEATFNLTNVPTHSDDGKPVTSYALHCSVLGDSVSYWDGHRSYKSPSFPIGEQRNVAATHSLCVDVKNVPHGLTMRDLKSLECELHFGPGPDPGPLWGFETVNHFSEYSPVYITLTARSPVDLTSGGTQ